MAGEIVASNDLLKERSEKMRELFDSNHSLRLFQNDFAPHPKHVAGDFIEAGFAGYARINMSGKWKLVFKVIDGEWQYSSVDVFFTATTGADETIFGWYLVGSGKVKLSCRLPFGKRMTMGEALQIRLDCQTWAASIL